MFPCTVYCTAHMTFFNLFSTIYDDVKQGKECYASVQVSCGMVSLKL